MKNSTVSSTIPAAMAAAITRAVASDVKTDGLRLKAVDLLEAAGVQPEWLKAPAKDARDAPITVDGIVLTHIEFYNSVKRSVRLGFSVSDQRLLDMEMKSVPPGAKADRYKLQTSIGSKVKDLKNALSKRLNPAPEKTEGNGGGNGEGEAGDPAVSNGSGKSPEIQMLELVTAAIKKGQGIDYPTFDVTGFCKAMNVGLAILAKSTNARS